MQSEDSGFCPDTSSLVLIVSKIGCDFSSNKFFGTRLVQTGRGDHFHLSRPRTFIFFELSKKANQIRYHTTKKKARNISYHATGSRYAWSQY